MKLVHSAKGGKTSQKRGHDGSVVISAKDGSTLIILLQMMFLMCLCVLSVSNAKRTFMIIIILLLLCQCVIKYMLSFNTFVEEVWQKVPRAMTPLSFCSLAYHFISLFKWYYEKWLSFPFLVETYLVLG